MKIVQLGKATVCDVDVYGLRCGRSGCSNGAAFQVDYPNAQKLDDQLVTCGEHLSAAVNVINEPD
jgi:hypothetical protein